MVAEIETKPRFAIESQLHRIAMGRRDGKEILYFNRDPNQIWLECPRGWPGRSTAGSSVGARRMTRLWVYGRLPGSNHSAQFKGRGNRPGNRTSGRVIRHRRFIFRTSAIAAQRMAKPTRIPPSRKPPEMRSKPPSSRQMIPAKGKGGLFNFGTRLAAAGSDLKVHAFLGLKMGENAEQVLG